MVVPRRAASRGASPLLATAVRPVLALLGASFAFSVAALGVVSLRVARRVVTPAPRVPDTRVVALDTAAQTVTLTRSADTALPGRYGLFVTGSEQYVKLGSVLAEDDHTIKRKLLTHVGEGAGLAPDAAFSGWYFSRPEELHLPFAEELIGSPVGPCPAWLFPGASDADTWVIQVHGPDSTRSECLRAVPVFHSLGITSLVVSYRNDGEAPRSRTGTSVRGATDWHDVDAAIGFARRRGAKRVVLMGWSVGGAIALQLALSSAHADVIAGIVVDSPVVDLAFGARPSSWVSRAARSKTAIPFPRLNVVARAGELRHPILLLHSEDDGFVPSEASHLLAQARPDLVQLEVFTVARHTKLWNYDQERWDGVIRRWLTQHVTPPRN